MEHFDYKEKVYSRQDMERDGNKMWFAISLVCAFLGGLLSMTTLEVGPFIGFIYALLMAGGLFLCFGFMFVIARVIAEAMAETKTLAKIAAWLGVLVAAYLIGRFLLPEIFGV